MLLTSLMLSAQTPSVKNSPALKEGSPESSGMSPERLARIDRMCEKAIADGHIPGVVALVARNGKIVYWKAYGMADNEAGRRLKRDDIFRIASQSKAITATAVMMLWEEGLFSLDDPISKYIPEFKNPEILTGFHYADTTWTSKPAEGEITIRQLLTHTSGVGYGVIDRDERMRMIYEKAGVMDLFTTKPVTIEESVRKLAALPLHFEPGSDFLYSEGLDVLGYFVEVVSGMSFSDFLETRIFKPLGMNDTHFYQPKKNAPRLVTVQYKPEGKWAPYPVTFYDPAYPVKGARTFYSGGAGLSSTVHDYAVFLQMYLNGGEYGGIRLLSRTTVETIMRNQIGDIWGEDSHRQFGLAFDLITEAGQAKGGFGSEGTFSWGGYFNTSYFADPQEQTIGLIFKQTRDVGGDDSSRKFRQLVFQAIDD